MWDEKIKELLGKPRPIFNYIFTNDKEKFINRMEQINEDSFKNGRRKNLVYLDWKNKINKLRNGATLKDLHF
jgi:hypothetical protein